MLIDEIKLKTKVELQNVSFLLSYDYSTESGSSIRCSEDIKVCVWARVIQMKETGTVRVNLTVWMTRDLAFSSDYHVAFACWPTSLIIGVLRWPLN